MANFRITDLTRNQLVQQIQIDIDAGAGPGTIKIYDGAQPADADDSLPSGTTLLAQLTFNDPSAPGAAAGVLTFSAITEDSSADDTGTATWARIEDSDGNTIFDCDVGIAAATIILNSVAIVIGGPVDITSFTVTVPAG
ncbi:hypothetical protein LCGC14_0678720 [marine sediment metagenome]|uniref:Uncharacterized protein n=1 Tax=marine sediment metagenome TaxID=412755 RepID=A0A0F9R948_9ZZZZ